jgi:uncharacterized protein YpmS
VLVANYAPLAFIEAFNHTLFEGQFNANQIDSAGYIDISTNNLSQLDSIYRGLLSVPSTNPMNTAINNSISIYNHFENLLTGDRTFNLNVLNVTGTHSGVSYTIDSTTNNLQYQYDSLLANGFTQANAITTITSDQSLNFSSASLMNGQLSFQMQPNSVQLFQFVIPEIVNIDDEELDKSVSVYPNPTSGRINIDLVDVNAETTIKISNALGQTIHTSTAKGKQHLTVNIEGEKGIYFLELTNDSGERSLFKVIKN